MSRFILLGMVDERAKPPAEWLRHLHEVGQWERLIELGKQSLGVDPLEASVHRHLAWAYGKTGRFAQMRPHVEFLLGSDPGEPANGHVAAIYCLEIRQLDQARRHIDDLLKHDPENANYHYLACIHSLRRHDIPAAERSIRQARALAPHWAAAAHLEVKISAIHHTKARQAWQRIRQLEEALALDPEDDAILASIGDVHLHELEQPREAEQFYRNALAIDPLDADNQAKLLEARRSRSLLYRTLSLPVRAGRGFRQRVSDGRINPVWLLLGIKPLGVFLCWLVVMGAVFTPAAWVYQWLLLDDLRRDRRVPAVLEPLLRSPFWMRLMIALSLIVGVWAAVVHLVFKTTLWESLGILAWMFGLHFVAVLAFIGFRRLRAGWGKWREDRLGRKAFSQPGQVPSSVEEAA